MKLVAFRIQNYRSVIDTDWQKLSPDNLTVVIGQNESGKSAILEGLDSFYSPKMHDDSLRSDDTFPSIGCRFKITEAEIIELFGENIIPRGLKSAISQDDSSLDIIREWVNLDKTILGVANPRIKELLDAQKEDAEAKVAEEIESRRVRLEEKAKEKAEVEALLEVVEAPTEVVADQATLVASEPVVTVQPAEPIEEPKEQVIEEFEEEPIEGPKVLGYDGFMSALEKKIPEFVLFKNNASFLPPTIDLDAIINEDTAADGYVGARNFLDLTGLSTEDILISSRRRSGVKIRTASKKITLDFHDFWKQYIGKETNQAEIEMELKHYDSSEKAKIGKPYLVFWVRNGEELLQPNQRSKGLQWFLSFFLQLRASTLPGAKGQILLIDEPGESLHIKAQKDVLKVFEKSRKSIQIIYSTHSPYLIEAEGIHRILAVQRSEEGDTGESEVFSARKLGQANVDTLFPILSLIGADIASQNVIERTNNVILEEPSAFYYLKAFLRLTDEKHPINFLPATGASNVRKFVNLFLGWGIDFLVVIDDDPMGRQQIKLIQDTVYGGATDEAKRHLMNIENTAGIEDVFTKGDFRKFVLQNAKLAYTESNSEYVKNAGVSKQLIAIDFYLRAKNNEFVFSDLATTTQQVVQKLLKDITTHLDEIEVYSGSQTIS